MLEHAAPLVCLLARVPGGLLCLATTAAAAGTSRLTGADAIGRGGLFVCFALVHPHSVRPSRSAGLPPVGSHRAEDKTVGADPQQRDELQHVPAPADAPADAVRRSAPSLQRTLSVPVQQWQQRAQCRCRRAQHGTAPSHVCRTPQSAPSPLGRRARIARTTETCRRKRAPRRRFSSPGRRRRAKASAAARPSRSGSSTHAQPATQQPLAPQPHAKGLKIGFRLACNAQKPTLQRSP
jgi:hypothetical protein